MRFQIARIGDFSITPWSFLQFALLVTLLFWGAAKVRSILVERVLPRTGLEVGTRQAVGSVTRYLILFFGTLIILQSIGINLTTVNVLAGTLGIGIGFGLQNVASNFISGLIILIERPIKVGDRIAVGEVDGDVVEIGARSTTVLTNNNIAIIIPNSRFVTENIVNWKYRDNQVRFEIPVGVAYGSDIQKVERILLEIAENNPDVLKSPAPDVIFLKFGDSSLDFILRVWNISLVHKRLVLLSALNFEISRRFQEHGIQIPFPQRDLWIRNPSLLPPFKGSEDGD